MQAPSIFIGEFYFCCFQPSFLHLLSPDNPNAVSIPVPLNFGPCPSLKPLLSQGLLQWPWPDFKGQTFKVTGILVPDVWHPLLTLLPCLLCPHSILLLKFSIQSL